MIDRYKQWRKSDPTPVLDLSEYEKRLWLLLGQEEYNFIYQFKLFLTEATEHIATQLIPIYQTIVLSENIEELAQYTAHPRQLIRFAAEQKIDLVEGRPIRKELVELNPLRWPQNAWNFARHRLRGIPGAQ